MVVVAAGVVARGVPLLVGDLIDVLNTFRRRLVGPVGAVQRVIGVGDICLVVLVVMRAHGVVVDVRLERVVVDRESGSSKAI